MAKIDIVKKLTEACSDLTIVKAKIIFDSFLSILKEDSIEKPIILPGFGTFYYRDVKSRKGKVSMRGKIHEYESKPYKKFCFKTNVKIEE